MKTNYTSALLSFLLLSTSWSLAAGRGSNTHSNTNANMTATPTITWRASAPERSSSSLKLGLGFATQAPRPMISFWIAPTDKMGIQTSFGIGQTTGHISINSDANFGYSVVGNWDAGLSLGGGLSVYNENPGALAVININGVLGVHATIADRVLVRFTGGPSLAIATGTGSSVNFAVTPFSSLAGLSVIALF